jgi:hypothetical protein
VDEILIVADTELLLQDDSELLIETLPGTAELVETSTQGPPGPPGDIPGFLAALSPASDTAPDVLIVRQGAEWMRATYAQLRLWAGARNTTTRGRAVTVGGLAVTTTE